MARSSFDIRQLIAYSSLAAPLAIINVALLTYIPSFYASEIGLSMTAIGIVAFLGRIWDAAIDPVIGVMSDRTRSRFGRRKSWVVMATPLMLLGTYVCFNPGTHATTLYFGVVLLVMYCAWTMVQIPYLSWGAELSTSYHERSRIAGFREASSMIGVVLSVVLPLIILRSEHPALGDILKIFTVTIFATVPLFVLAMMRYCKDAQPIVREHVSLKDNFRIIAGNKPFLRFLIILFAFRTAWAGFDGIFILIFENYLKMPGGFLPFILVQYAVSIGAAPLVVMLTRRWSKHRVLAVSLVVGALFAAGIMMWVKPGNLAQGMFAFVLFGMANASLWIFPTAIVADLVDYGKFRGGGDVSGTYMAVLHLAHKFGLAAGVGIVFPLLDWFGFRGSGANTAEAVMALRVVAGGFPALLLIPAALWLWNFPIDKRRFDIINRWLSRRDETRVQTSA